MFIIAVLKTAIINMFQINRSSNMAGVTNFDFFCHFFRKKMHFSNGHILAGNYPIVKIY